MDIPILSRMLVAVFDNLDYWHLSLLAALLPNKYGEKMRLIVEFERYLRLHILPHRLIRKDWNVQLSIAAYSFLPIKS